MLHAILMRRTLCETLKGMQGACMTISCNAFKPCKSRTPLLTLGSIMTITWNYKLLVSNPTALLLVKSLEEPRINITIIMNADLVTLLSTSTQMRARITATLLKSNLSNMVVGHRGTDSPLGWFFLACTSLVPAFSIHIISLYCLRTYFILVIRSYITSFPSTYL